MLEEDVVQCGVKDVRVDSGHRAVDPGPQFGVKTAAEFLAAGAIAFEHACVERVEFGGLPRCRVPGRAAVPPRQGGCR